MAQTSPLDGKLVTLIGGNGFLGTHIAQDLLARGARLRIASRHPERAMALKPLANLGQLEAVRCNVANRQAIARCVAGADAVVYLVGTFAGDQQALQADGAGHAARAAAAGGARSFVYLSAINAGPNTQSGYARTKADGEQQVLAAGVPATIIRPSLVFGESGGIIPMLAALVRMMPVLPVFGAGAKFQPVWASDVARAVSTALEAPAAHGGRIYEAAGPEILTMREIHERIARGQQRRPILLSMPDAAARLVANLPLAPINADQLAMLNEGSVATPGMPGLADLGIAPSPLGLFLDRWMVAYRRNGRFTGTASLV